MGTATICTVNRFYVTFEYGGKPHSEPLKELTLSWDDEQNRLKILITFSDLPPVSLRAQLGI